MKRNIEFPSGLVATVNAITNESRQSATVYQHGREKLRKAGAKGNQECSALNWNLGEAR